MVCLLTAQLEGRIEICPKGLGQAADLNQAAIVRTNSSNIKGLKRTVHDLEDAYVIGSTVIQMPTLHLPCEEPKNEVARSV